MFMHVMDRSACPPGLAARPSKLGLASAVCCLSFAFFSAHTPCWCWTWDLGPASTTTLLCLPLTTYLYIPLPSRPPDTMLVPSRSLSCLPIPLPISSSLTQFQVVWFDSRHGSAPLNSTLVPAPSCSRLSPAVSHPPRRSLVPQRRQLLPSFALCPLDH